MTREEAIEVYHGLLNQKIKEAFEVFAPELRESEDERIRKKIISAMSYYRNDGCISEYEFGVCRNWLEKQKEQKPAEWSEEDEAMRDNILRVLSCIFNTSECESNPSLSTLYPAYQKEMDWLKSLKERMKGE